ncbi:hypothetical protein BCV71DRAFT_249780 [Rhizopus microsporus]|uniref:Uncharacterized protein n=1 Tax=Rhizopus microsporus TaxID=58291 RepID=A0A1X0S074_RHIZD|nr:hypothetical protein BCV71DRAFT_249780 [Rhizopus microsporus]
MQPLLSKCEEHSLSLGYRWNPKKCVIVDPNPTRQKYYLYNSELPNEDYFPYLGVPIKSGGIIDKSALLQQNINKALGTMRQLVTLGFLIDNHRSKLQEKHTKLLFHCRNDLIVDPILRISMTRSEWSRCVRWRLGWLHLGKPQACSFHPNELFSRQHSFSCLDMHNRLQMPKSIDDPLSYLLNLLPPTFHTRKGFSFLLSLRSDPSNTA